MDSQFVEHYSEGRLRWLDGIVDRIVNDRVCKAFKDNVSGLSRTETALLVSHVGLSHIYGIPDTHIVLPGFLSEQEVVTLISRHWRDGYFDVRLASSLAQLWACLYRVGLDTNNVRPELALALFQSELGSRMATECSDDLEPSPSSEVLDYVKSNPQTPSDLGSLGSFDLAIPGSHIPLVHALLTAPGSEAASIVTTLEQIACTPDDERMAWDDNALRRASQHHLLPRSVIGGWPGPRVNDIPPWVRDSVMTDGARMSYASVGFVPGWFIVAESTDDLNALRRWAWDAENSFILGEDESGNLMVGIELTLPSTEETVRAWWSYSLDYALSLSGLKTMVALGVIRLDIYHIDSESQLRYISSFGCRLPKDLTTFIRNYLIRNEPPSDEVFLITPMTEQQELSMMAQVEQHAFEGLHLSLKADHNSDLGVAFRQYLEIVDATTAATFKGYPADIQAYESAREKLRLTIAASATRAITPIDLEDLGKDRAYAQFRFVQDGANGLVADVAYLDASGDVRVKMYEFTGGFDGRWPLDRQSEALAGGFSELKELVALGVCNIVVNPHSVTYNLPYHEALLRIGFHEASYSHRAATLRSPGASKIGEALVTGFAGEGTRHIQAVDTELEFIKQLYKSLAPDSKLQGGTLPDVVHLSGHGTSGSRSYEVGLEVQPDAPPLSSAQILLNVDASQTELVYLSACSTGRGSYGPLQIVDTVPLDVAFIEKGARSVLSTSAPVNDNVACFFACTFHHALVLQEATIWDAYQFARTATRNRDVPTDLLGLRDLLAEIWPTWRSDLAISAASSPNDWQLFRLSGRHWE